MLRKTDHVRPFPYFSSFGWSFQGDTSPTARGREDRRRADLLGQHLLPLCHDDLDVERWNRLDTETEEPKRACVTDLTRRARPVGHARESAAVLLASQYYIAQATVSVLVEAGDLPKTEAAKARKLHKLEAERMSPTDSWSV